MKSQIDQLKSEAEANYSASRWEDSAKTYEHLVGLAQNNSDFEQAIDFAIAAIRAWTKVPEKKYRINRLYQAVGIIGLNKAAIGFEEIAIKEEGEKNLKSAAGNFEEAGNGYSLIQSYDLAKNCYQSAANIFKNIVEDVQAKNDSERLIHLLDRSCTIYSKLATLMERIFVERKDLEPEIKKALIDEKRHFEQKINEIKKEKAVAHEKLANHYLEKDDVDCNPIAEKEYLNAIKILESIGEPQEAKKLKSKLDKIPK